MSCTFSFLVIFRVAYVDRKKPMLQIDKVQIPPECCKRGKGMLTPTEEVEVPPTAPKRLGESPPSTSQEHAPERRTLHGMYIFPFPLDTSPVS
ncbi:hypothetical protein TNCT_509611 [Trichonephila clavata]|uniref:Uncharacterized protein n=1 Tax=Trichonephila clavata TaxID=2740835 RepID=A0A8X6GJV5_TRICU|nr:hypothetical protein TNCT_509611 [Trichonephila clavata]